MDKERINAEASKFSKDGSCYIHCECVDGMHEAVITGDSEKVMVSLAAMVEQIAVASHTSFVAVLSHLLLEHHMKQKREEAGIAMTEATSFALPKMPKNKDSEE